jgi:flavodoxin/ferredoxin
VKSALIVYFSQRGTNGRVAEAIGAGLREKGYHVALWNLKDGPPPEPRDHDVLGVGTPTYYFRAPFNVTDYVNSLQDLSGLPAFVFVVHGAYRGNTGNTVRRALRLKGAREVGYFHCLGADYFLGYLKEGCLISPDHPTADELGLAVAFGRDVAARLAGAPYAKPDDDPQVPLIYRLERFLANRTLVKLIYSRCYRVNGRCRPDCDLCIRQCPVRNIRRDEQGMLAWGRNCLLCLSCEMNCPEDAITSPVSWRIFRPFMTYNTRRASRDPSLDSVRVIHSRGQTRRLS